MRRKILTVCEACGSTAPSGAADFVVFHCLTFCSTDCRDNYRAADDERRGKKDTSGGKHTKPGRARTA